MYKKWPEAGAIVRNAPRRTSSCFVQKVLSESVRVEALYFVTSETEKRTK